MLFRSHLDNRVIKVAPATPEFIINPNQRMVIRGEGMPNLQDNMVKGDLIILFDVQFPESLDKERAKYLVKILPQPKKQIWDTQLEKTPENELTQLTMESFSENYNSNARGGFNKHANGGMGGMGGMDDDSSGNGGFNMPGPVECATQ